MIRSLVEKEPDQYAHLHAEQKDSYQTSHPALPSHIPTPYFDRNLSRLDIPCNMRFSDNCRRNVSSHDRPILFSGPSSRSSPPSEQWSQWTDPQHGLRTIHVR